MRQGQLQSTTYSALLWIATVAPSCAHSQAPDVAAAPSEESCGALSAFSAASLPSFSQGRAVSLLAVRANTTASASMNTSVHSGAGGVGWSNTWMLDDKITGKNAPLSSDGYDVVAALEDDKQMEYFVLRVIKAMHLEVIDEGGLHGVVPYHSGLTAAQNFNKLKGDLRRGLKPHGKYKAWLRKAKDVSDEDIMRERMKEEKEKREKAELMVKKQEMVDTNS
mmetsp:Transcript_97609/g.178413  ORF Transcript_97609/g.178413 Transcript_97609/m.178413 type:complete len:222 (-) Transcript_97609:75-740(-)